MTKLLLFVKLSEKGFEFKKIEKKRKKAIKRVSSFSSEVEQER